MVHSTVRRVIAALVAGAALWAVGGGVAAGQGGERVVEFFSLLRVEEDGDLYVEESITYDFAGNQRHGIFRFIRDRLRYEPDDRVGGVNYDRVYPVSVVSVESPSGAPADIDVTTSDPFTTIRIGDPDRTITGVHTYTISYRVEAVLNGFDDHVELYWNALGSQWEVPVETARVRVETPATISDTACFAGPVGSSLPCGSAAADGASATFSSAGLGPGQDLTVVVAIPTGAVPAPVPRLEERWSFQRAFSLTPVTVAGSAGLLLASVGGVMALGWKAGRDRRFVGSPVDVVFGTDSGQEQQVPLMERPVTPVEFAPPDGVRPGQVGTLIDERANPLDVIATVVDLAVRGGLRIDEVPKRGWFGKPDWELVQLTAPGNLKAYERRLYDSLFQDAVNGQVQVSALKNTFATRLGKVQDELYDDVVAQGWFLSRPDHARVKWAALGLVVAGVGAGLVVLAAKWTRLGLLPVPLVLGGLLLAAASRWMPRRTAKGTGALRRINGFRRFIEESEAERAQFAERKHLFSEYLPYAIVFGCTEKWARAFAGLDDQLPEVAWYSGTHGFTVSSFSESMDGFTVTTAGTLSSTPAGSGSSGFGGGGSSGGGGGGGGGGSW
jgi:uncharacterized membrane protein YgcG